MVFGWIFGVACVAGLAVLAARGGRGHSHGWRGHRGYGRLRRAGLRYALERLDTTPGQEKAIVAALDQLRDRGRELGADLAEVKKRAADAFRADRLDPSAFAALFDAHEARLGTLKAEVGRTAATIHEALAPEQRAKLASMLESRLHPTFGHGC